MAAERLFIPPFIIVVDGCPVTIYEVAKVELVTGQTVYHVVVSINYKGVESKRYTLDVSSVRDLIDKLKVEITKIKMVELAHGFEAAKKVLVS